MTDLQLYCLAMIFFSTGYFLLMGLYSGRFFSSFSIFWPITALCHGVVFCGDLFLGTYYGWRVVCRSMIIIFCFFVWIVTGIMSFLIIREFLKKMSCVLDCVIVLGAQIRGERLTQSLVYRLERTVQIASANPHMRIVVSGGRGRGEDVTEAYAMAQYLLEHGIDGQRIFMEDQSHNTRENLKFSGCFIEKDESVGIVTNSFHCFRARRIAKKIGYDRVYSIPAKSNHIFFINYLVREVVAFWGNTIVMAYKRNVKNFSRS